MKYKSVRVYGPGITLTDPDSIAIAEAIIEAERQSSTKFRAIIESRKEQVKRIDAMCELAPLPAGTKIDRSPSKWWKRNP